MAEPGAPQPGGVDKSTMKQFLGPAVALAAVVVLAGLVVLVSGGSSRSMSDGSNGSADDPELKEVTPGVRYRDIKVGTGTPCPEGADVKIHYTGWLTDGTVFDSSRDKGGQPAAFSLNRLIKGWQEGIPGMKPGGIRKLVISSDNGYGAKGSPPKIPGGSTLIFEVELVEAGPGPAPVRPRRSPAPTDLTKLSDDTAPGDNDPNLKSIGTHGLKYRDIKEGDGPVCPEGANVVMDYTGWLTNGSMFDSSWKGGGDPLRSSLGGLIKGWQQGVPGMKVGGIRKLVIPPNLGYGDSPQRGIPANSTLVFEIELLGTR